MNITFDRVTTIPAGVAVKLSPQQAQARSHALEPFDKKKGCYVGTHALQFKAGETVEIIGHLPKGILPAYDNQLAIEPVDKPTDSK